MDIAGDYLKYGGYSIHGNQMEVLPINKVIANYREENTLFNSRFHQLKACLLMKFKKAAEQLLLSQREAIRHSFHISSHSSNFCRKRLNKHLMVDKAFNEKSSSTFQRLNPDSVESWRKNASSKSRDAASSFTNNLIVSSTNCQQLLDNVQINQVTPENKEGHVAPASSLPFHTFLPRTLKSKSSHFFRKPNHVLSFFSYRVLCIVLFFLFSSTGASDVWWSPGCTSKLVSSAQICQWARQVGGKQAKMCRNQMNLINTVRQGIKLGADSCQREMQDYRWNCSQNSKETFEQLMQQGVREAGFVHAITSAAITYQVTIACAKGDIEECGCTNTEALRSKLLQLEARKHNVTVEKEKLKFMVDNFDWGGCGDNIDYGVAKSREFLSLTKSNRVRNPSLFKDKIKEHNQEAGRLAIKNHMRPVCRCHGLTGSCTMQACWNNMERFSMITARLETKYKSAVRVSGANGGNDFIPMSRKSRKKRKGRSGWSARSGRSLSRKTHSNRAREKSGSRLRSKRGYSRKYLNSESIVYAARSRSFCAASPLYGSLGTKGRQCRASSRGLGSCKYLCCGRGYRSKTIIETRACNCRLNYCCVLDCDECSDNVTLHHCL